MIEILQLEDDRVVGIRMAGKTEKTDVENVFEVVEEKLQRHEKLRVYVEAEDMGGMTLEALLADLRLALPKWRKFERKAVVIDKKWAEKLVPFADKLFPSIDVRQFGSDQVKQAKAWIQE